MLRGAEGGMLDEGPTAPRVACIGEEKQGMRGAAYMWRMRRVEATAASYSAQQPQ
jgi:hypothetical protein